MFELSAAVEAMSLRAVKGVVMIGLMLMASLEAVSLSVVRRELGHV
jgi:DMSO/TMAO reductase YedYZ heme-binding membrane subunit